MYVLEKKKSGKVCMLSEEEKIKKGQNTLKAINDRVGIYNVSLLSLSPSPSRLLPLFLQKRQNQMPAAAARCPLLLLLLLLRKNVNQCHLTTQMQKTKRFKYIHNPLFQSLNLSPKKGHNAAFFLNLQKNRIFPPQDVVQPSFIDEILSLSLSLSYSFDA